MSISDMVSHIQVWTLLNPWSENWILNLDLNDPWVLIAILGLLFTVVLPLIALSIPVVFLVRKFLATARTKRELKAEQN